MSRPRLLDRVNVGGEVAALHRPVVDHGEMHEAVVGKQEEVTECIEQGLGLSSVLELVEINHHSKHENRRHDRPDAVRESLRSPFPAARIAQAAAIAAMIAARADHRDGQIANADQDCGESEHDRARSMRRRPRINRPTRWRGRAAS